MLSYGPSFAASSVEVGLDSREILEQLRSQLQIQAKELPMFR